MWHVRRWNLRRAVKAMQIRAHDRRVDSFIRLEGIRRLIVVWHQSTASAIRKHKDPSALYSSHGFHTMIALYSENSQNLDILGNIEILVRICPIKSYGHPTTNIFYIFYVDWSQTTWPRPQTRNFTDAASLISKSSMQDSQNACSWKMAQYQVYLDQLAPQNLKL